MATNEEVNDSIRPLLKLSRETIMRCQKTRLRFGAVRWSVILYWPRGSSG